MDKGLKYVGNNEIIGIAKGSQVGYRLYLGGTMIWAKTYGISYSLDNVTASGSSLVVHGNPFSTTLEIESGYYLIPSTISVTMGGADITSTAYDPSDNTITISTVTGDVSITAQATEIIVFEDSSVKDICVTNWGGNYVTGEITAMEAAAVTTLNSKFYNNRVITKFNELKYFTSLTSLFRSGSSTSMRGQLSFCTNLEEVTIPEAPITNFAASFRNTAVVNLDLSKTSANDGVRMALACYDARDLQTVVLPTGEYTNFSRVFYNCTNLTTIRTNGAIDLSGITSLIECFYNCTSLTTIEGEINGIRLDLDISDSPLSRASAMVLINGLDAVATTTTITFSSATYATLTADDIATATAKGWTVNHV